MTKTLYFSNACKKLAQKKQTLQPFLWTLFSLILLVGSASTRSLLHLCCSNQ